MLLAISLALSCQGLSQTIQDKWNLDLGTLGYQPPPPRPSPFSTESVGSPHLIDFDSTDRPVVGFVKDRPKLNYSRTSGMKLHIAVLGAAGTVVHEISTKADSWYQNSLIMTDRGNFLIRTGYRLKILSDDGHVLASLGLPTAEGGHRLLWSVTALPNRKAVAVTNLRGQLSLFSTMNLHPLFQCTLSGARPISFSNHDALLRLPERTLSPLVRTVEARRLCGDSDWTYGWKGDPASALLVDDDRAVLAISALKVLLIQNGRQQWQFSLRDRHDDIPQDYVKASANGKVIAFLVRRFSGGSAFLDLAPRLRGAKLVILNSRSGREIGEVPIHVPARVFDFAISRDGHFIATLEDGKLRLLWVRDINVGDHAARGRSAQ